MTTVSNGFVHFLWRRDFHLIFSVHLLKIVRCIHRLFFCSLTHNQSLHNCEITKNSLLFFNILYYYERFSNFCTSFFHQPGHGLFSFNVEWNFIHGVSRAFESRIHSFKVQLSQFVSIQCAPLTTVRLHVQGWISGAEHVWCLSIFSSTRDFNSARTKRMWRRKSPGLFLSAE